MHQASTQLTKTSIRYFLEVAKCGSVTTAAEQLFVAPSAISRQIAALEELLNVSLFERRPRGMALSVAGELLAAHARRAALEADKVVGDILELQGLQRGKINLACTEGFAISFLPDAILEFQKHYAGIQFDLNVTGPDNVTEQVREGSVDIGLTFNRVAQKEINIEYRHLSPILAIMHPDHALAKKKSVSLAELAKFPLALPTTETSLRQIIDIACSRQDILIEPRVSCNCAPTLHKLVLANGIVSLAGEVSVRHLLAQGQMVGLPIRDKGIETRSIEVQTLTGRMLPKVVTTFLDFLKQQLKDSHAMA